MKQRAWEAISKSPPAVCLGLVCVPKPSWHVWSCLDFLSPSVKHRKTASNISSSSALPSQSQPTISLSASSLASPLFIPSEIPQLSVSRPPSSPAPVCVWSDDDCPLTSEEPAKKQTPLGKRSHQRKHEAADVKLIEMATSLMQAPRG